MKTSLLYLLVIIAVVSASAILEGQREKRSLSCVSCDNRCSIGGCLGAFGTRCWGVCYCFGSGYEYRCKHCDL